MHGFLPRLKRIYPIMLTFLLIFSGISLAGQTGSTLKFSITYPEKFSGRPLDGRLLLMISDDGSREPRFQITDGPDTQLLFGRDVNGWRAGEPALVDDSSFGYPLSSLRLLPAGDYWVQALLHRYETFHRADGHVIKLPMDRGEGQHWNIAPGNFYSAPVKVHIDPAAGGAIKLKLSREIPPFPPEKDTKYLKHIRIKSKLLSKFWGRPMYLGAIVLLPEGFEKHPEARYPLMINHGHFHRKFVTPEGFRETPPDPSLTGYAKMFAEYSYRFYKDWTGPNFPRVIIVMIQHANPYFDDSYAVNSANLGPYGDAITYELIPYIEKKFRSIGQGWARTLYGGSTGGWEALGAQVFYPDEYNGCWANCPDPVDFRAYSIVDIYRHQNAYFYDSRWQHTPRPGARNYLGEVLSTMDQQNHLELALGDHSRSGGQWDIWQAVFGPVGADGYRKPIWDKMTGEIDHRVAEYWREHYDLRYILQRDWHRLGAKLKGKIHINVGDMDTYYLNNAVYLLEKFLRSTTNPYYDGSITYGDRFEHCWSGDPDHPNSIAGLTINQRFIPEMVKHILKTAPAGADTTSWRY